MVKNVITYRYLSVNTSVILRTDNSSNACKIALSINPICKGNDENILKYWFTRNKDVFLYRNLKYMYHGSSK